MKTKLLILAICLLPVFAPLNAPAKNLVTTTLLTTSSGTVAGPCKQVTFIFGSAYTGTVAGVSFSFAAGGSLTLNAFQSSDTLDDIAYTVTAGNLTIVTVK